MRSPLSLVTNNWQLKITSVVVAFLLWLGVQGSKPYLYRMSHVPVRISNRDAEWVIASTPSPATVSIEFHAPFRDLLHLSAAKPVVVIPVADVTDTAAVFALKQSWVNTGDTDKGVLVGRIDPDTVRVSFDRVATRLVTLHARFTGKVADGYELAGAPMIDPSVVRASGAARRLARLDTIYLQNIDISGMRGDDTVQVNIDTAGLGAFISPTHARVLVPIRRKLAPLPGTR
jgi:YbbR domain-containing protein